MRRTAAGRPGGTWCGRGRCGLRRVAIGIAAVVVVLFVVIAALLGRTSSEGVEFGPGDQVAMVLLGAARRGAACCCSPGRAVVADLDGVRVRNIFTTKDVPWEVVRAVSFPDGTPWAMLDLADDDQIAVLAVQAADGRARGRTPSGHCARCTPGTPPGKVGAYPRVHMG